MELVTIICTVKNGENTIDKTIESVIKQTYTHWEMLIVDDGSTDRTLEIIEGYIRKNNKIKLEPTRGIGRGAALNLAVELANGEFVANIDSDDLMHPQRIEEQVKQMKKDKDIFLISTSGHLLYGMETPEWYEYEEDNFSVNIIGKELLKIDTINHSSVMMRKILLQSIHGYDETRKSQFDYELWLRAFINDMKMIKIEQKLTGKRIHSGQSFENKKRIRFLWRSVLLQIKYIIKNKNRLHYLIYPVGRMGLGLFPFKIRRLFRKVIRV